MHTASRQIGIDMGHRVTNHGSKCRNIHGHRYTIEAEIRGDLISSGESEGMVLDFSFLKEEMMNEIDNPCDHGLVLWRKDPLLNMFQHFHNGRTFSWTPGADVTWMEYINEVVDAQGWVWTNWEGGKLYVMDTVPTAENLAKHWFGRLQLRIALRTNGKAYLSRVKVWETPNCSAEYSE